MLFCHQEQSTVTKITINITYVLLAVDICLVLKRDLVLLKKK